MANENVAKVAKTELKKEVVFRRRRFEIEDVETKNVVVGEYIEVSCKFAGETVRFKVDDKSSKMVKALMRMHGYALVDVDGISVVHEDAVAEL